MSNQHQHDSGKQSRVQQSAPAQETASQSPDFSLDNANIVNLQRLIGNRTVQRMIKNGRVRPLPTTGSIPPTRLVTAHTRSPDISREDEENVTTAQEQFERGRRAYEAGQYQRAAILFERARQVPGLEDQVYTMMLYNLGRCNLYLERFATAVNYFEQYLERSDADVAAAEPLLEQARAGTLGDSERILERDDADIPPPSSDPDQQTQRAQALFQQANALYQSGQYRQAIIIFEQLREMDDVPNLASIRSTSLYNIGMANLHLERYATAVTYFEQYMDTEGADINAAMAHLTEAQQGAGALTNLEQGQMMQRMAQEAYDAGDYETALERFQHILSIRGFDQWIISTIRFNIGMCYLRTGRPAEAVEHFTAYLQEHPGDATAEQRLQEAQEQRGSESIGPASALGDPSGGASTSPEQTESPGAASALGQP